MKTFAHTIHTTVAGARALPALARRCIGVALMLVLGVATSFAAPPSWQNPSGLLNTMTLHGTVQRAGGGAYVGTAGSMLAAFKGSEIRGVTTVFDGPATQMQFQLSVGSNAGSETGLTLKCYDAATDQVFDVSPGFDFAADTTLNSLFNPGLYIEDAGPLRFTAAAPGSPAGLGSGTVTVAGQVTVLENGSQVFSVTPTGGTAPYAYSWSRGGVIVGSGATYTYAPDYSVVLHPNTANLGQPVVCTITDAALAIATATWSSVVTQDVDRAPSTPQFGVPAFSPAAPVTGSTISANASATDPDGDAITYTRVWTHGSTTVTSATLASTYTKKGQTWTVEVTATTNPYGTGTVSSGSAINSVVIGNTVPVANTPPQQLVIQNSPGVTLTMTGTDADVADGIDTLTFAIVDDAVHGAMKTSANGTLLGFNPVTGTVTYIPATGFTGTDTFEFTCTDGTAISAPATFTIPVYEPFNMVIDVAGAGGIDSIEIGTAGGATDNADPGIDALAPPVPAGKGNVRLISPGDQALLNGDFRAVLDGAIFYIEIIPDADDSTPGPSVGLTWDANDLPDGQDWHMWQLSAAPLGATPGEVVAGSGIDMATELFIEIPGFATGVAPNEDQDPVYFMIGTPSAPTIASVSPAMGPTAGGTAITLTGTDFRAGAEVTIGGTSATDIVVVNATTITCKTPATAYTGTALTVTVTNADTGIGSKATAFLFNDAPTANAGGPYAIGLCVGATLNAVGSSDPNTGLGDTLTYAWDLDNDGTFETLAAAATLVRTYAQLGNPGAGTHTIGVRVTDSHGLSATATTTIVRSNTVPVAHAGGLYVIDEGGSLQLNASQSTDPDACSSIALYEWDLDNDGQYDDLTSTTAVPPALNWATLVSLGIDDLAPVAHPISVRVTDGDGGVHTAATTLTIYRNLPDASFTVDTVAPPVTDKPQMSDIVFASTSTHGKPGVGLTAYAWDFDYNGSTFRTAATGATVTWRFPQWRKYTVALRVTDANGRTDIATGVVTINQYSNGDPMPAPTADAGGAYTVTVMTGLALDGTGSSGHQISYAWDLNNNGVYNNPEDTSGATPTITPAKFRSLGLGAGTHTIRLRVTDSVGVSHDTDTTITVIDDADVDGGDVAWTFPINVAFGSETELVIGVAPTGNQGADEFDEEAFGATWDGAFTALHTPNGGPSLQTAINNNDVDGNEDHDYADWILEVRAGDSNPVYLWWDNGAVPAAGLWLFELDNGNGVPAADGRIPAGCVPVDMSTENDLLVLAGETKYYRLVYGKLTQSVEFKLGWNLFSLANAPFAPGMAAILGDAQFEAGTNWGWNPVTQQYGAATTFEGLGGYWGYFNADATIAIDGIRINDRGYLLEAGWNLVGVSDERVLEANPDLFLPGYWYDAATGLYSEVNAGDTLVPGRAYWFYAIRATLLNP